jgi:hypothetical protein
MSGLVKFFECRAADDEVELSIGKGQVGSIAMLEIHAHARFTGVLAGDAHERSTDVQTCDKGAAQPRHFDGQITRPRRDFEDTRAGIQICGNTARCLANFLAVARGLARVPGGDKTLHPAAFVRLAWRIRHIGRPFARCAEATWELQVVCAMSRERQMRCSAAATGDFVPCDRAGQQARPQKNRAPVPGIPGLQQSQFHSG